VNWREEKCIYHFGGKVGRAETTRTLDVCECVILELIRKWMESMDWFYLARCSDRRKALWSTVIYLMVP
jgi:hypothetical protein